MKLLWALIPLLASPQLADAQAARVWPAPTIALPAPLVDGNSPSLWHRGSLQVYTSTGALVMMRGNSFETLGLSDPPVAETPNQPIWIEAIWKDDDDTVYAWYHHEPGGLCGGKLTAPQIGALVSRDGGQTFQDLGIVLSSGHAVNCEAPNGFFASGHGDFSVIPDVERGYFYFLFTNYGGPSKSHGVAVARMAFADRANPAGALFKLHDGDWNSPGIGGEVTPVLPAATGWDEKATDSYWGPSIHWNTFLGKYVILLNRACCEPGWPQEGIYIQFASDLSDPAGWTTPAKLLDAAEIDFAPAYYPQAVGMEHGESDSLAGAEPRLFIKGISNWVLVFSPDGRWGGVTGCTSEDLLRRSDGRGEPVRTGASCGPAAGGLSTGQLPGVTAR